MKLPCPILAFSKNNTFEVQNELKVGNFPTSSPLSSPLVENAKISGEVLQNAPKYCTLIGWIGLFCFFTSPLIGCLRT